MFTITKPLQFLASMRFLLLQRVKTERPLSPQYGMQLTFEAPVYFRETNTEAIRTLISDNAKDKEKDRITRSIEQGNRD